MELNYKVNEGKIMLYSTFIMPGIQPISKKCSLNKCMNECMNESLNKGKE